MAYPYLPVNPCCTEVVINDPCGCSSTITNGGCNDNPCGTHLTASSTIVYDGPALTCTNAEPCDTLNVILQKIDEIICNLLTQINALTIQVNNITTQIININGDIININNQLDECCNVTTTTTSSSSTTTSTTTVAPTTTTTTTIACVQYSWNLTGIDPKTVVTIEWDECGGEGDTHVIVTQEAELFSNPFVLCSISIPIIALGTITSEGDCNTTTTTTTIVL